LNEAEISKQKYIMGVVHEIKTPLAAVQTFLDLVLQKFTGPISDEVADKLQKARARSEEAIETINDVLRISKLKLLNNLSKTSISIDDIIEKIISQQRINAESKAIGIQFCDKRERKEPIMADPVLLELALSNLIGNAVKYSYYTGKIEITAEYKDSGTKVLIEVADNGVGIPNSELQNIFKEFYRASNIKQIDYEGTGLGLSVVKQIVEQHGGTISAESPSRLADENGKGASFKILLPVE
jgi:signal transduction histidine kinase